MLFYIPITTRNGQYPCIRTHGVVGGRFRSVYGYEPPLQKGGVTCIIKMYNCTIKSKPHFERKVIAMTIAICDDDLRDLEEIQSVLTQYDTMSSMKISSFTAASELLVANAQTPFDIAILDIEMEPPNGYEIAQELSKQEASPIIIFLTNSEAYAILGYGIAFRYLTKPIVKDQLFHALDRAICEVNANRFTFTAEGASHIIRMKDIYYFEVFNHHTILHAAHEHFTFRATLKEVAEKLPKGYFGSPHQSYLVNFMHVQTATAGNLCLTNGAVVPVSRRRQQEFESQLYRYLGR